MKKVIIYSNSNGGVSVVYPTGELSLDEVLKRDCPTNARIYDQDRLPADYQFFDAWELHDDTVTVNFTKAQNVIIDHINKLARAEAARRRDNTDIGLENNMSDADFAQMLKDIRASVTETQTLEQLKAIDLSRISSQ